MRNNFGWTGLGLVIFGILALGCPAGAQAKTVEEIAVVVGQEAMTRGELEESTQTFFLAQGMKPAKPGSPDYETARKNIIDGFIQEVLLAEEADRNKIEVSETELDREVNNQIEDMKKGFATEQEFNEGLKKEGISLDDLKQDAREKILRRIKASRALRMKQQEAPGAAVVTDDAAREFFNEHPQDYEQVKFSIILFRIQGKAKPGYAAEVEKQAQGLLKELKVGADFAAYAKKYSEDQGSAEKGGAVGTVYRSELEPKLAKGIFAIPEKGIGIVRAMDGFYIVKVDFKGKADFPSVAPGIKDHLRRESKDSSVKDWLVGLRKKATILVDGKVDTTASTSESGAKGLKKAVGTPSAVEKNQDEAATAVMVEDESSELSYKKNELYPSLSPGGGWTLSLTGEGFSYGIQDLSDIHGSGIDTKQSFPFGFGLSAGLDFAIEPTLQIGFLLEGLQKTSATVTDTALPATYKWSASALAPSLALKAIIPLDESTNFILSASGGYHFLFSGNLEIRNGTSYEAASLAAANWGGKAGGSLEFFLDERKNTALQLGVDYRLLRFNPVTTNVTEPNILLPVIPSPLLNSDLVNAAAVDFSGVNIIAGLRFYLDKND